MPFGNPMAGAIAEQSGAPLALAGGGTVTLILFAIVAIALPALRRSGRGGPRGIAAEGFRSCCRLLSNLPDRRT